MIFFRKHAKETCLHYEEALEEALCLGWIDSLIKKIDRDRYARKFTPRKDPKKWSPLNQRKVIELIKSGKMTQAGIDKIDVSIRSALVDFVNPDREKKKSEVSEIPELIIHEFARNEPALINFNGLTPSCQRQYIAWITHGKRDETIMKRIKESIGLLKENRKLGLK